VEPNVFVLGGQQFEQGRHRFARLFTERLQLLDRLEFLLVTFLEVGDHIRNGTLPVPCPNLWRENAQPQHNDQDKKSAHDSDPS
jgi:hypothetical protein